MKVLVVVDMQKDFVDGALGTPEAVAIVPAVVEKVKAAKEAGDIVIFTRDTHTENYIYSREGKDLPVVHCVNNTPGWEIIDELKELTEDCKIIDKPTFGSTELGTILSVVNSIEPIENITFIGLCTDICVISNALLARAFVPEMPISVDAKCCAGVSRETHLNALAAMKVCQIKIENEE